MSTYNKEYLVIGGGIAGIAIAEILARNGKSVMLIEKNGQLCSESSGRHHEWYHFGSLYTVVPGNSFFRTILGGIDDILEYYTGFKGMNLSIDKGKIIVRNTDRMWIRPDKVYMAFVRPDDPDFDDPELGNLLYRKTVRTGWNAVVKRAIARHQKWLSHNWNSYGSESIPKSGYFNYEAGSLMTSSVIPDARLDGHDIMRSVDHPMNSRIIIEDLLSSLLYHDGTINIGVRISSWIKNDRQYIISTEDGSIIMADTIINATGSNLSQVLNMFKLTEDFGVSTVTCPLIVHAPAVTTDNFVRVSPLMKGMINVWNHHCSKGSYSVIGSGSYAVLKHEVDQLVDDMLSTAERVLPNFRRENSSVYYGTKTEIVGGQSDRDYQYHIIKSSDSFYSVVPGKFVLAPALAVDFYRRLTGDNPRKSSYYSRRATNYLVAPILHRTIAEALYEEQDRKIQS